MFIILVGGMLVVCHVHRLTCSCRWWPAGCVSGTGVGPFVVVLGAKCQCSLYSLGMCQWSLCSSLDLDVVFAWVVACSLGSGTGVGPFIIVLSTGVGGVSVFVIVFVLVQCVCVDLFIVVFGAGLGWC